MTPFEQFLKVNRLKKKEVAAYLGIVASNMTVYCREGSELPEKHVKKLLGNPFGWKADMLKPKKQKKEVPTAIEVISAQMSALRQIIDSQAKIIASYEAIISSYIKREINK